MTLSLQMVNCTFSGIREQTTADELSCNLPSTLQKRRNQVKVKDMRCFFQGSHLTVITRGGLKYVNNLRLQIDEVFPMEDGLLIRALFNSDLISFELGANPPIFQKKSQTVNQGQGLSSTEHTFVYLSLLEHPLNEAFPVNIAHFQSPHSNVTDQQHVNTELLVFSVSPSLPLCLVYEPERRTTRICLICRHKIKLGDSRDSFNGSQFFREQNLPGVNSSQNHAGASSGYGQLPQIFGPNQVAIITLFETDLSSESPPDNVHICRGLADSSELTISLFYKSLKQVHVFATKVTGDHDFQFERKALAQNVDAMQSLNYIDSTSNMGPSRNSAKIMSRSFHKRSHQASTEV